MTNKNCFICRSAFSALLFGMVGVASALAGTYHAPVPATMFHNFDKATYWYDEFYIDGNVSDATGWWNGFQWRGYELFSDITMNYQAYPGSIDIWRNTREYPSSFDVEYTDKYGVIRYLGRQEEGGNQDLYPQIGRFYDWLYNAIGKDGDMNVHDNDADDWNVTIINQTKQTIILLKDDSRSRYWNENSGSQQITVDACKSNSIPLKRNGFDFSGWARTDNGSGAVVYNVRGAYNGTLDLLGNWTGSIYAFHASFIPQGASGSSDWVAVEGAGMPICGKNQAYNCVVPAFVAPKNVATSIYSGGHGDALRRYSTNFQNTNSAYVVFKPRNEKDGCGLDENAFLAYVSQNLPNAIANNPEAFITEDGRTLAKNYPNINPKLISGGLFNANWGQNGEHGLPSFSIDANTVKIKTTQKVPGTERLLSSSINRLTNDSGI